MAAPVYLVLREWRLFWIIFAVMVLTSVILKFNWWDKLESDFGDSSVPQTSK
jgi:hypothetical protein